MKNNSNIDLRRNYIIILKHLEELIKISDENELQESTLAFKRAMLLIRGGVLKVESRVNKKNNS
mgnify:CR=1 FL=1